MVVDDSVVVRKIVTDVLSEDPGIEVVGTAVNGKVALSKMESLKPDLITMDIEMPEMNGIEAVRAIRAGAGGGGAGRAPSRVPIIMFSTLTERGATATLDALSAGANDYVTKPANVGSVAQSMESVRQQLIPKIKGLTGRPVTPLRSAAATAPPPPPRPAAPRTGPGKKPAVLVIGSSTGGPEALARVLPALPANLPVPVLLAQHMPPVFTRQFAQRLDRLCALRVVEAVDGTPLVPGTVHLAPGDHHLVVRANGRASFATSLNQNPPENFCRPAVDPLFRSAVAAYDGAVLGVVLTGMGADGRNGCGEIRNAGGTVVVQDQATSVVWGMPGAVAQAGYADEILPLDRIAEAIHRHLAGTVTFNSATTMAVGGRR
nr:chemotaxis response regulator protein-glutamate methylesterase [Blastococcus saxobsidens]